MDHGFTFRPNTQDAGTFHGVVIANEYRLPESLSGCDLVVDIGMNIGSFCYAALTRGAGEVHGYEPDPTNFSCAEGNLQQFGARVHLHHGAVWRSDGAQRKVYLNTLETGKFGPADEVQTACGHLKADGGQQVPMLAFDDLVRDLTRNGRRRINLLKIDSEGSEYPILFTSRMLHLVDEIVGEYHNIGLGGLAPDHPFHHIPDEWRVEGFDRYTSVELLDFLRQSGFEITSVPHPIIPAYLGNFTACRSRPASIGFRGRMRRFVDRLRLRHAS